MPSPRFAVISEGATDYEVIHSILAGFFADDAIVVRQLQPNPATPQHGNWAEVLKYCSSERFAGAFHDNDFVVIQIDTDVCERAPFNVPRSAPDGQLRSVSELIEAVRLRLIDSVGRRSTSSASTRSSSPSASTPSSAGCSRSISRTSAVPPRAAVSKP